jgi:predicted nucleotidyltransferase
LRSVDERYRGKSVRVFALDAARVRARLEECARALVRDDPYVEEVRLFGSLARGEAHPGSDADLLVVLRASRLPFLERGADVLRHFARAGIGCDVFAYTRDEIERMRAEGNRLIRAVDAESVILAARP